MSYDKNMNAGIHAVNEDDGGGPFLYERLETSKAESRKRVKTENANFLATSVAFYDLTSDAEECTDLTEYEPAPKLFKKEPHHEFVDAVQNPGVFTFSANIESITPEVCADLTAMDVDESTEEDVAEKTHVDSYDSDDSLILIIDESPQDNTNLQPEVVSPSNSGEPNSVQEFIMDSGDNSDSVDMSESPINLVCDKKNSSPRNVSFGSSDIERPCEKLSSETESSCDSVDVPLAANGEPLPTSPQGAASIECDSLQNDVNKYAGKLLLAQFSNQVKRSYMTKLNARLEADSNKFAYKANMARAHDDSAIKKSQSSRKNANLNAKLQRDSMRLKDIEGDLLCEHLEKAKLALLNVKTVEDLFKLMFQSKDFLLE